MTRSSGECLYNRVEEVSLGQSHMNGLAQGLGGHEGYISARTGPHFRWTILSPELWEAGKEGYPDPGFSPLPAQVACTEHLVN